jgi:hypothetical protein
MAYNNKCVVSHTQSLRGESVDGSNNIDSAVHRCAWMGAEQSWVYNHIEVMRYQGGFGIGFLAA